MSDAKKKQEITSVVAREEGGNIQITFTIPYSFVTKAESKVVEDYSKEAEIDGFRKGKAPLEKVREKIPINTLVEKALAKILPQVLAKTVNENKIRPAIYPKFELISAKDNKDWQVRAITCELPKVTLGDYKKALTGISKARAIWTPGKGKPEEKPRELSKEEKDNQVIKILLETTKISIPKLLISEEVDARLSSLLERIEHLGLSLEGYLGSIGKTPESLRAEYEIQAKNTISLELILNEVSIAEKMDVSETEIDGAIKAASADPKLAEKLNTPEQRRIVRSVILRRKALDYLSSLL